MLVLNFTEGTTINVIYVLFTPQEHKIIFFQLFF